MVENPMIKTANQTIVIPGDKNSPDCWTTFNPDYAKMQFAQFADIEFSFNQALKRDNDALEQTLLKTNKAITQSKILGCSCIPIWSKNTNNDDAVDATAYDSDIIFDIAHQHYQPILHHQSIDDKKHPHASENFHHYLKYEEHHVKQTTLDHCHDSNGLLKKIYTNQQKLTVAQQELRLWQCRSTIVMATTLAVVVTGGLCWYHTPSMH